MNDKIDVVAGTLEVAKHLGLGSGKTIVTVLCDLGQRYASKIYNEKFLLSKNLPVANWLRSKDSDRRKVNPELYDALAEAVDLAIEKP